MKKMKKQTLLSVFIAALLIAFSFQGYPIPNIVSLFPADNDKLSNTDPTLIIEFNTLIMVQSGYITIYNQDGSLFEQIAASNTMLVTPDSTLVHIDPVNDFVMNSNYYVLIDSLAFSDLNGQNFDGIYDSTCWNFTIKDNDGFPGTALDFDGTYGYVNCGSEPQITGNNPRTIEAWAYTGSFNGGGIFQAGATGSDYQDFSFRTLFTDNNWRVQIWGADFDVTLPNSKNNWHHYCLTYDGTTARLYYDGELADSSNVALNTGSHDVCFGMWYIYNFDGEIDEVRIWNIARTETEIREHMYLPLSITEAGLVGYWQFNNGTGTTAYDIVGGYNGTLYNMANEDWIASTIPFGNGASNTQIVSSTGNIDFTGTGISMDFTAKSGTDTIVVSRIDTIPNITPATVDTVYDSQYWVGNCYGNGTFTANLSFTIAEDLTPDDQNNPSNVRLYGRTANSIGGWTLITPANAVDAASNTATFNNINSFGQFILGRHEGTVPPRIVNLTPPDGGTTHQNSTLQMIFNQDVWEVTNKSIRFYHVCTNALLETITLPSSQVTGNGSDTITITPSVGFLPGVKYYILIDKGAFKDPFGNDFEGIIDPEEWNFSVFAQGHIASDVIWCDSITVTGDIYIDNGVTLEVLPGAYIYFQHHYKLDVKGRILAQGTEYQKIKFTGTSYIGWDRLQFDGTSSTNDTSRLVHCVFEYGHACSGSGDDDYGGAIYVHSFNKLLISYCFFKNNIACAKGGAMYFYNSDAILTNNMIIHNLTQIGGGIYCRTNSNLTLINNLFYDNTALDYGGGISVYYNSNPVFLNNTICNNTSNGEGGGIYVLASDPVFRNNILYGNMNRNIPNQVYLENYDADPDFYYCDIEGGKDAFTGTGAGGNYNGNYENNIDANPQLLVAGDHPFSMKNYSPCINTGDPATTTADVGDYDVSGGPRFLYWQIDMRAYEILMVPDDFAGTALDFDGVDDWIDCGNDTSLNISNAITVEAWIKADPVVHNYFILKKGDIDWLSWDYQLESITGKGLQINLPGPNTGWWEFQYDMEYRKWYHVAWTFSSDGELTAYINGEITRQGNFPGSIQINTDPLHIAAPDGTQRYKGLLDEIRIWDVVRSHQEIRENMYLTLPESMPGLVSYWQFNAGEGNGLADLMGGNRGKLHNMTDDDWVNSTIPFGKGISNTQIISSTGNKIFINTGMEMDFLSKTGTDTVTVSRIDTVPNIEPLGAETAFSRQYWVVNQFGTGDFSANFSFTVNEELTEYDELNPSNILLFNRENTSDTSWILLERASAVDAQNNTVTFDSISNFGQFIISKNSLDYFPGTALFFNGTGGHLELANESNFDFDTTFTIEFWVNIDSVEDGYYTIFSKGNAWELKMIYTSNVVLFEFGINNNDLLAVAQAQTSTIRNKWNHISCVYHMALPDEYIVFYLNGIQGNKGPAEILIQNADPVTTGNDFKGKVDELRFWNTARTDFEIRENMHLTLSYPETGLLSYLQLNEGSGTIAKDVFGGNYGALVNNPDPVEWVNSSIPFGGGTSNTQNEQPGTVDFTGTGLSMDFSWENGASITVSEIDTTPNLLPPDIADVFDTQYWAIHRYGDGSFNADLNFSIAEDLTTADEGNPGQIKLYTRESNSATNWVLLDSARHVDAANNKVKFENISNVGQFIIGRKKAFSGLPGHALAFDGVNDHVLGSGMDTNLTAITIEAWVKHNAFPAKVERYITIQPEVAVLRYDGTVYGGYRELHFYIKKANGHHFSIRVDSVLTTGEWLHVAGTYDGTTMNLYLNGVLLKTEIPAGGLYSLSGDFEFGSSSETMNGKIDEIRVWSYARSTDQIRESMHRVIDMSEEGLVNYWQCNEGGGSTITDVAGNLVGTLEQMDLATAWVESSIPAGKGISITRVVNTTGPVDFSSTGLDMYFIVKTGADPITVTRISLSPNLNPPGDYDIFDSQYWAVNNFGSGLFNTELTFHVNEDLTIDDAEYPFSIKLFSRASNSDGPWVIADSAFSIDPVANTATFDNINHFCQYILARGNYYPDSIPGHALDFDGVDDFVRIPADTALTTPNFTVEFWISNSQPGAYKGVIDKGRSSLNNWYFLTATGAYPQGIVFGVYCDGGRGEIICEWNDNNWHHVAGTFNGNTMTLFVDGIYKGTANHGQMIMTTQDITFGGRRNETYFYKGNIDEIRIWDHARGQEDIQFDMCHTITGNEEGLSGYWRLDEYSGEIVYDRINNNNGTLINMIEANRIVSTAPLPFYTIANGNWETSSIWAADQNTPEHNWARVRVEHNITINSTFEVIELNLDASGTLTITTGYQVTVGW